MKQYNNLSDGIRITIKSPVRKSDNKINTVIEFIYNEVDNEIIIIDEYYKKFKRQYKLTDYETLVRTFIYRMGYALSDDVYYLLNINSILCDIMNDIKVSGQRSIKVDITKSYKCIAEIYDKKTYNKIN